MGSAQESINLLWIILCAILAFQMQAGFLLLESGLTRRKNSINIAIKNLADFCLAAMVFWTLGFALMFGPSRVGWFGQTGFLLDFSASDPLFGAFFLFQMMFCGVAVTIMSGAAAERMRFSSYLIVAFIVSALVYPIFGHWAWAGLDRGAANGWLNSLGYIDVAGSSVVHSVGGWAALALLLVIGPRRGRFSAGGTSARIRPSNLPLATLGVVILYVGWLGFTGGNALGLDRQVTTILINTVVAGAAGAISAGILGQAVQNRLNVTQFMFGCLGGLVGVSASCFAVATPVAALIGLVGGMIAIIGEELLEHYRIDDAVGAIPIHLGAGIWGTLAVGLYGNLESLATGLTRMEQIGVQMLGIMVCGVWTFGVTYVLLTTVNCLHPLRVTRDHEIRGLNISEHGELEDYEIPGLTTPEGQPVAEIESQNVGPASGSITALGDKARH